MELVNKVLNILNSMSGVSTVLYESPYFSNIKVDRKPEPYGIVYLLQTVNLDLTNNLKESTDIEVLFCKMVPLGADGEKQGEIVDDMMVLAKQFISLLKDEKSVVFGDNVVIRTAYAKFDKNLTGVSVELTLTDRQSKCLDSVEPEQRVLNITANGEYDVTQFGKVVINV